MNRILHIIFIVSVLLLKGTTCLQLKKVTVPSMVVIEDETVDPIALDCHYELDESSKSLVVKWLKDNNVVFQWIRGHSPSVFPDFKEEVDETFSVSSDPNHEHSGLLLTNPTIESTGTYKCIVQTDKATLSLEKKLQIIDIKNYTLKLEHIRIQNETHLECTIENVYPTPTIHIKTVDDEPISILSNKTTKDDNGLYDASAIAVLKTDEESADEYKCSTTFVELPFNLTTYVTSGCISFKSFNWIISLLSAFLIFSYIHARCRF